MVAYLDDILIYSKTLKKHIEHVIKVLKALEKAEEMFCAALALQDKAKTAYLAYDYEVFAVDLGSRFAHVCPSLKRGLAQFQHGRLSLFTTMPVEGSRLTGSS